MTTKTATYRFQTAKGTEVTVWTTATKGTESSPRKVWADGQTVEVTERKPVNTLQSVVTFGGKILRYSGCIATAPAGLGVLAILGNRDCGLVGVARQSDADAIRAMVADLETATSADPDWQAYLADEAKADAEEAAYAANHAAINRAMGNQ